MYFAHLINKKVKTFLFLMVLALQWGGCSSSDNSSSNSDAEASSQVSPQKHSKHHADKKTQSKADSDERTLRLSRGLGLAPLGNTCFANAVHQLLSVHPTIQEVLQRELVREQIPGFGLDEEEDLTEVEQKEQKYQARVEVQRSFLAFIQSLIRNRESIEQDQPFEDRQLFQAEMVQYFDQLDDFLRLYNAPAHKDDPFFDMAEGRKSYIRRDQIDAHEYLTKLLDFVDYAKSDEVFIEKTYVQFSNHYQRALGSSLAQPVLSLSLLGAQWYVRNIQEAIDHYFRNKLYSQIENDSKGGAEAFRVMNFRQSTLGPAVQKAIAQFKIKLSPKEDAIGTSFLAYRGENAPSQLIVQLSRNMFGEKDVHRIEVSPEITLHVRKETASPQDPAEVLRMQLAAVVVHSGIADAGHYIAYTRLGDLWLKHNDARVSVVTEAEARATQEDMNRNGYLFLYRGL